MFKRIFIVLAIGVFVVCGGVYFVNVYKSYKRESYGIHITWSRTSPLVLVQLPQRELLMVNTGVSQDVPSLVSKSRYFFEKQIKYIVQTGTHGAAQKGLYWLAKKFTIGRVIKEPDQDPPAFSKVRIKSGDLYLVALLDSKRRCVEECAAVFICRQESCFLYSNVFRKSSQRVLAEFISEQNLTVASAYMGKVSSTDSLVGELVRELQGSRVYVSPSGKKADEVWVRLVRENQAKEKPLSLIRLPVGEEVFLEL